MLLGQHLNVSLPILTIMFTAKTSPFQYESRMKPGTEYRPGFMRVKLRLGFGTES